ncbi:MAG: RNA-binding S4 domain-containing protein [Acetivibrio sp.]
MQTLQIKDEFIKLGQALKLSNLVESGIDAKLVIQDGLVKVNGQKELQRGKKLRDEDIFEFNGQEIKIKGNLL